MVRVEADSTGTMGCGWVEAAGSLGIAYLVDADLAVTCGHTVQHLVRRVEGGRVVEAQPGATISVTFGNQVVQASVEKLDYKTDVAVLRLAQAPVGLEPFGLGEAARGPCTFGLVTPDPSVDHGMVLNTDVANKYGDPRMTLRAPALGDYLVEYGQPYCGSPVLRNGRVIGQVIEAVLDPREPENAEGERDEHRALRSRCYAGLVSAVSVEHVRALLGPDFKPGSGPDSLPDGTDSPGRLGRKPAEFGLPTTGVDAPPAAPTPDISPPPISKKEYHAFVSYRARELPNGKNDSDWTHGLMDRLGTLGYRCFPAAHLLYGDEGERRHEKAVDRYGKALAKSRVGLLVFSQRWLEKPAFAEHAKALLERARKARKQAGGKDPDSFRLVLVRLDDSDVPESLAGIPQIMAAEGQLELSRQQRVPGASTVREIAAALKTEPAEVAGSTEGSEESGMPVDRASNQGMAAQGAPLLDAYAATGSSADQILRALGDAKKEPKKIQALALRWLDAGMPGSDVPVEAARLLIGRKAYDSALAVLDRALAAAEKEQPRKIRDISRIKRMQGAALGKADRNDEAIAILEGLENDGLLDHWSGGILASNYKRKWDRLGRRRGALLQKSFDVYRDTYARTLHFYPGINAATLAVLLGHRRRGLEIARAVRDDLEANDFYQYWDEASLGEAYLLLGEFEKAVAVYADAAVQGREAVGDMAIVRRQIPLVLESLGQRDEDGDTDSRVGAEWARSALIGPSGLFQFGSVAVFIGPTLDLRTKDGRSLVEVKERLLRRRIREALSHADVAFGFCLAYAGSDLLFAEAVLERSGEVHLLLPCPSEAFKASLPTEWQERFRRILKQEGRVQVEELRDEVPADRFLARATDAETALNRAMEFGDDIDEPPTLFAVWEGEDASSVEGRMVEIAHDEGLATVVLDLQGRTVVGEMSGDATPVGSTRPAADDGSDRTPERASGTEIGDGGFRGFPTGDQPSDAHGRAPGEYDNKLLFVVGIDSYMNWRPLENARHDAEGIRDALVQDYGFELVAELYDRDATRDGIEKGFGELAEAAKPNDLVVVFFAGHGHTERRPNDEEVGFLVPVEAPREGKLGMLRMSEIRDWTNDLASRHVLYIFDSCFSGSATTGGGGGGKPGFARRVITAGAPDQVVADGGAKFGNHSVFTWRLLHGLSKQELTLTKPVFAKELASYLERHVPVDSAGLSRSPQTPSEGVLPGHGGSTIVLLPRDADRPEGAGTEPDVD